MALDNLSSDGRPVANISMVFSAPLGGSLKKTSKHLMNLSKLKGESTVQEINLKIDAQHTEILESIRVLKAALKKSKK